MATTITLTVECTTVAIDESRVRTAIQLVLSAARIENGCIGVAILSDDAIHELNKRHLDHDYATDTLSFLLEQRAGHLEGEIAVSAETAVREAAHFGWPAADELLLYVVHAALHLVGEDDTTPQRAAVMRRREREVLGHFGLVPPWDEEVALPLAAQSAGQEGLPDDR